MGRRKEGITSRGENDSKAISSSFDVGRVSKKNFGEFIHIVHAGTNSTCLVFKTLNQVALLRHMYQGVAC